MEAVEESVAKIFGGDLAVDKTNPKEIQIPCNQKCGKMVTVKEWAYKIIPFVTCDDCYAKKLQEEALAEGRLTDEEDIDWRAICPYDDTDLNRMNVDCVRNLMDWNLKDGSLFLTGVSGAGKTRSVWSMLHRLHRRGKSLYYFEGNDFSRKSTETAAKPELFMRDLIGADIVVLDDLKFTHASRTAMSNLADMIKKRGDWKRATLIVSQETPLGWLSMVKAKDEIVHAAIQRRVKKWAVQRFVYKSQKL